MTFKMILPEDIGNGNFISSSITEDDQPVWVTGTTYAEDAEVIVIGSTHAIFKSTQGGNQGNPPETDTAEIYWVNIGSTNRWKAFDEFIGDPSIRAGSMEWVLDFTDIVDSVALFKVKASEVTVVVEVGSPLVEVYNVTRSLINTANVIDAYTYCFSKILTRDKAIFTDLPPFGNATFTVSASTTGGGSTEVGQVVVGKKSDLGEALNGIPLGIEDFSDIKTDIFGRTSIQELPFLNLLTVPFVFNTDSADLLVSEFAERRAKPTVYTVDSSIRDNDYAAYGFFSDFRPIAQYGPLSEAVIEIRSLV